MRQDSSFLSTQALIYQMFRKDFLGNYKKSFLGITWLLAAPLVGIISWLVLNFSGILVPGETKVPYPFYILIGLSLWNSFVGAYTAAAGTLSGAAGLLLQVKFPHEVLLIKQLLMHFVNVLINFALVTALMLIFNCPTSWWLPTLPLLVLPLIFWGAAIGLIISVVSAVVPDVRNTVDLVIGFGLYLTPVIYVRNMIHPIIGKVVAVNPLAHLIEAVREMITLGDLSHMTNYAIAGAIGVVFFALSVKFFFATKEWVFEKM